MEQATLDAQELTAADIFAADDLTISEPYAIPEWKKNGKPGVLYFRVMSADATIKFQEKLKTEAVKKSVFVQILAECACDSKGTLLFTPDQLVKLREKSTAVFARMQKILLQLNGMVLPEKNWDTVREILIGAGVDPGVIAAVQIKWDAPDETLKNVSGGGPTSA